MFICRVCGYTGLEHPQYYENGEPTFEICSCCGFEAGYDDLDQGYTIESYRKEWLDGNAKWFDPSKRPVDWNLEKQLRNIKNA